MALENSKERAVDRDKTMYFSKFAISNMEAMRVLQKGKVLGSESEGWRNVSEHCLLGGVVAYTLGRLAGLSREDLNEVTHAALTHDSRKRLEKEEARLAQTTTADGRTHVIYDVQKVAEQERSSKGLTRVTGSDWSDFETWRQKEKILRYMDSCLGTAADGRTILEPWRKRLADLARRHPKVNETGREVYGMLLYDKLGEITEKVERDLFETILEKNSEMFTKFLTPADLQMLVEGAIKEDIAKV